MDRDRQQAADFKSGQSTCGHERKEWGSAPEKRHQMETREHARLLGKPHRTHDLRAAEAEHQIRELRARY